MIGSSRPAGGDEGWNRRNILFCRLLGSIGARDSGIMNRRSDTNISGPLTGIICDEDHAVLRRCIGAGCLAFSHRKGHYQAGAGGHAWPL
jgi:hypothetical protein